VHQELADVQLNCSFFFLYFIVQKEMFSYNRTQDKDNIEHTLTTVQADYENIL
jgi:hypothetical protein